MASNYLQKFQVPDKFPNVLHDFAKGVLKDQPANIYEFGYQYFKALEEVSSLIRLIKVLGLRL
jgi:hypothetical protein